MRYNLLILFMLIGFICKAEIRFKLYHEETESGYNIYVDNHEFCPISIEIEFSLTNLTIEGGKKQVFVINAIEKKKLLTTLKVAKLGKAYRLSYKSMVNYGNHNLVHYDEDYIYDLPYSKGYSYRIEQGYNGRFSHQNENSLDFKMPVGSEVTAIREGIVVKVIDEYKRGCANEECKKYNNFIIVYHPDGTFAEYTHIQLNGSRVSVGELISKGQVIALSGNVGWSTGPHLHLTVFKQQMMKRITLETRFRTGDGDTIEYLVEKNEYARDY